MGPRGKGQPVLVGSLAYSLQVAYGNIMGPCFLQVLPGPGEGQSSLQVPPLPSNDHAALGL